METVGKLTRSPVDLFTALTVMEAIDLDVDPVFVTMNEAAVASPTIGLACDGLKNRLLLTFTASSLVLPNQSVNNRQKFLLPYELQLSPVPYRLFSAAWFGRYGV